MRDTISRLAAAGRTVLMSTHLLEAAERLCSRVAIIRTGVLQAVGTPAELRARYAAEQPPACPGIGTPHDGGPFIPTLHPNGNSNALRREGPVFEVHALRDD
jgi:ABC-type multidrug transport system ATPase subunit